MCLWDERAGGYREGENEVHTKAFKGKRQRHLRERERPLQHQSVSSSFLARRLLFLQELTLRHLTQCIQSIPFIKLRALDTTITPFSLY